jgi:RsiW-degrading membrane proteinase PrsW (M82 family)
VRAAAPAKRGSGLNLTRQPAYWLFFFLFLAGLGLVGAEQAGYFASYPGAWFLSILLLAAVAVPVGLIIYRMDQFEPEPASLIVIALLWGGVVALSFAAITNSSFLTYLQHVLPSDKVDSWGASLVAPLDEEFYKGAGLLMIYFMARSEIDSLMDGLVYGAMIGLGFQVMENVQYFVAAASESGGQIGAVVAMFFIRVVVAGVLHHPASAAALVAAGRGLRGLDSAGLDGALRVELPVAGFGGRRRRGGVRADARGEGPSVPCAAGVAVDIRAAQGGAGLLATHGR